MVGQRKAQRTVRGCHSLQVLLGGPDEMGSFAPAPRTLTSMDPTDPTLLLSLAGAAGDKGLPWLRPRRDRAAGGSIHHLHPPGGTSDFCEEETGEGKHFNCGMNADSWIWEDLAPIVSDWALLENSSNHYL